MASSGASRARAVATVLFTLLLLGGEFLLLNTVYHLGDWANEQRVAQTRVAGALSTVSVDSSRSERDVVATAVQDLARTGAGGSPQLGQATRAWLADPTDAAALGRVRSLDARVQADVDQAVASKDDEAAVIHLGLLVIVSIGWFFWFRRLVRRHRDLERTIAEREALDAGERRILALVQNSSDLVAVLEADSTISFVSPSSLSILGIRPEYVLGSRFLDMLRPADVPTFVPMLKASREGHQPVRLQMEHGDGRALVLEGALANQLNDPAINGWVLTLRDVTEQHGLQEELTYQAFHDSLTGLANRQLFGDRLAHALRRRDGLSQPLVVLFCDLDDFKNVNDSLGHGVGDRLLVQVGARIGAAIREGDTAARLGGDEFAILMEGADVGTARAVAERLIVDLAQPVEIDGQPLSVHASIGMAEATPGEATAEETLRNADVAMYWAKDRGKATVAVYEADQHAEDLERMALRSDLRRAIRSDELVLHYQPTVDLTTGEITGFEALVRWNHPQQGQLPPSAFIPMAEVSGQIIALGSWVLRAACRAGTGMQTASHQPSMAVNISSQQIARHDFVEEVVATLRETGMPADKLVLEITETLLLDDIDGTVLTLTKLRREGIRIAIDDFGTGYSSLSYLSQLPVDVLKVDKSFVDQLGSGAHDSSLVEAIISMSRSMQLKTVAEGVEQLSQVAWLQNAECTMGQGFLWSRPVDLEAALDLLAHGATVQEVSPPALELFEAAAVTHPASTGPEPRPVERRGDDELLVSS